MRSETVQRLRDHPVNVIGFGLKRQFIRCMIHAFCLTRPLINLFVGMSLKEKTTLIRRQFFEASWTSPVTHGLFQVKSETRDRIIQNSSCGFTPEFVYRIWIYRICRICVSQEPQEIKRKLNPFVVDGEAPAILEKAPNGILPKPLSLVTFVALMTSHPGCCLDHNFHNKCSRNQRSRDQSQNLTIQIQNHTITWRTIQHHPYGCDVQRRICCYGGRIEPINPFLASELLSRAGNLHTSPDSSYICWSRSNEFTLWIQNAYPFRCAHARKLQRLRFCTPNLIREDYTNCW